ncbi:solute carrier family 3 (neutral and basic amino acid transporter), member 1, partial [Schistosoma bovis]
LPVIYYGTEIDVNRVTLHYLPQSIYPKGKTYNDEPFDKYSSVLSHMPMPWDFNGKRFSATINDSRFRDYLNDYNNKKVVESELAEGNDKSVLRLVQKLVALRQNPSIKWGTMEQINIDQKMNQQETTTKISIDKEYRQYDYSKNFDKTLTEEQEEEDPTNCSSKLLEHQSQLESRLLTCEDLINLDKIEPRWRYIRIGLLIGFGIIFFGLLAACIVYIIVGEKCPSVPKLPFWKSTVGYWLDVFAFKDSSGDLVGDLNGLTSEVDYIKTVVGAGYVILGPITKGFYTNSYNMLGLVEDYEQLDEAVGTMADFRILLKQFHKKDIKVILTFDFNAISINHKWITENKVKLTLFDDDFKNKKSRYGNRLDVNISHQKYYSVFEYPSIDLDLTSAKTQKAIFNVIHFWMKEGIDGILLDNAAFFVEEEEEEGTQSNLSSTWLENCPNSQLYRNGSVKFVEGVREEMNKWIKESGKEKLLAVNSGDTGCGVGDNPDPMLMFRDVADLIISREFVWGRGEKERELTFNQTALQKYLTYTDSDKEILGLTTSTVHIPPYGDTLQLATTLLLPGIGT